MKRAALSLTLLILLFTSCKLKDSDTTNTVDPSATSMTVVLPNGGETIKEGSSYDIKWTSDSQALLRIQYTVDNGSTWALLADSIANTGTYAWFPVPNLISSQCKIRVSAVDASVSDQSDAAFSISRNENQSLLVKAPNGSESWEGGTQKQIVWYSSGIDSVKLEYTTDNGNHWNFIAVDKRNTGVYFWNPVPNTPSSLAKIRISDAKDSFPIVESEKVFSILPEQKLAVKTPNGGENWLSGTDQKIEWTSENISDVKLQYTTNGGANWTTIVETTPSVGFYTWKNIPQHNSAQCRIKVLDASDGQPNAISANNFTITNQVVKSLEVTAPNGGEIYESGTPKEIKWVATNVQSVTIEFTVDGSTWQVIADRIPNSGVREWTVPEESSAKCKIRIKDSDDATIVDESNAYFTIKPTQSVTVQYPNGRETIRAGEKVVVKWKSVGIDYVRIQYTVVNGIDEVSWNDIAPKVPASIGEYETSFTVPSSEYKIRVSDAEDSAPRDESDGTFTVLPKTSISVVTPNGGQHWLAGQTYELRWSGVNINKVKIEYTIDGEFSWNLVAVDLPSNGSYSWTVPYIPLPVSDLCKVRISEYNSADPTIVGASDISDLTFSIHTGKFLRIVSPADGDIWDYTTFCRIEWISTGISNVNLEYSLDGGMTWTEIVRNHPSNGAYVWGPPHVSSANAVIRITDSSDPSVRRTSGFFSLKNNIAFITLITPTISSNWKIGSTQAISWYNSPDIAYTDVFYSSDNGTTWIQIGTSVPSPHNVLNTFEWVVTGPITSDAKIMLTGKSTGGVVLKTWVSWPFTVSN